MVTLMLEKFEAHVSSKIVIYSRHVKNCRAHPQDTSQDILYGVSYHTVTELRPELIEVTP